MKIFKKIILMALCLLAADNSFAQQAAFSGTWKINLQKSEFYGAPQFTARKVIKITQLSNGFVIEQTYISDLGSDSVATHTFYLGKPTKYLSSDGYYRTCAFTSLGGNALSEHELNSNSGGKYLFESTANWTLSDDHKVMTIEKKVKEVNGHGYHVKVVYEKE